MSHRLHITVPAYAFVSPAESLLIRQRPEALQAELGWTIQPAPLLERHLWGDGAWLPTAEREADILKALESEVVWASRGGYGCIHLVDCLLRANVPGKPKLIGYSDITVLHALWRKRGWGEGYYGTLPKGPGRQHHSFVTLYRGDGLDRSPATDAAVRVLHPGQAEGWAFGACLSVLAGLAGTPAMPSLEGAVLFLEDLEERPFQIDGSLTQLHLSGALRGIRGLVGGTFHHQEKSDYQGPMPDELLTQWGQRLGIPVLSRLPFGHLLDHLIIPQGRRTSLTAGTPWSLRFHAA